MGERLNLSTITILPKNTSVQPHEKWRLKPPYAAQQILQANARAVRSQCWCHNGLSSFKGTDFTRTGLSSIRARHKVPLHLHQKAKALPGLSSFQIMFMLLVLTGHGVKSGSYQTPPFPRRGSTDYQGFKFKQTTKEGKY